MPIEEVPLASRSRVAEAICQTAGDGHCDLVVIGALRREGPMRAVIGSIARRVGTQSPCSSLLVSTGSSISDEWRRFIVGIDASPVSEQLMGAMLALARAGQTAAEVCFAYEFHERGHMGASVGPAEGPLGASMHAAQAEYRLAQIASQFDTSKMHTWAKPLAGRPGQEIARYAEDVHADLIGVMAPSRPLSTMDRWMSHPVVLLLDRLPCSVLLFKPSPSGRAWAGAR